MSENIPKGSFFVWARIRNALLICCSVVMLQVTVQAQEGVLRKLKQVRHAKVVVLERDLSPVAVIRTEAVRTDYQRKGFFRIGVLPMVVLEGMNVELCDPSRLLTSLTNVNARLTVRGSGRRAIECKGFSLSLPGLAEPVLRAKRVRIENGSQWRLDEGLASGPEGDALVFRSAILKVAGPETGLLVCNTTNGVVQRQLLSPANHGNK